MKPKTIIILLSLLFACSLLSCKKKANPFNPGGGAIMEADINGTHWVSDANMTYYLEVDQPVGSDLIGQSLPDACEIIIHWKGLVFTGTITLTDGGEEKLIWVDYPASKTYTSISGQVTVTNKSGDKITGTFSGQVREDGGSVVLTIANGVFTDVAKRN